MTNFSTDQKLMALSWKQPYAELMLHGKIETRTRKTNYRGWVLICASKAGYNPNQLLNIAGVLQIGRITDILGPLGYMSGGDAIAIGKLVDCRPMKSQDEDKCFVEWQSNLFCHVYEQVARIEPFHWRGAQSWKEVDQETKNKIRIL